MTGKELMEGIELTDIDQTVKVNVVFALEELAAHGNILTIQYEECTPRTTMTVTKPDGTSFTASRGLEWDGDDLVAMPVVLCILELRRLIKPDNDAT